MNQTVMHRLGATITRQFWVGVIMLLAFWLAFILMASPGSWEGVQFAFALAVIFGSTFVAPLVVGLLILDLVSGVLRFPWNVVVYIVFAVLLGWAYVSFLAEDNANLVVKARGPEDFVSRLLPIILMASVPPILRILDRRVGPSESTSQGA